MGEFRAVWDWVQHTSSDGRGYGHMDLVECDFACLGWDKTERFPVAPPLRWEGPDRNGGYWMVSEKEGW